MRETFAPLSAELVASYLSDFTKLVHRTNRNENYNEVRHELT